MINLIEFLLLYVVVLLFCPNNILTVLYSILAGVIYLLYLITYLIERKKRTLEKQQINAHFIFVLVMIISVNLVVKLEFVNAIFGVVIALIYGTCILNALALKKGLNDIKKVNPSLIFDVYSVCYFLGLIMVLSNEF